MICSCVLPLFVLLTLLLDRGAAPTGDGAARATLRAGVRLRALAARGQAAAVPDAAIAVYFDQALDVRANLLAQLTLDGVVLVDEIANYVFAFLEIPLGHDFMSFADGRVWSYI